MDSPDPVTFAHRSSSDAIQSHTASVLGDTDHSGDAEAVRCDDVHALPAASEAEGFLERIPIEQMLVNR